LGKGFARAWLSLALALALSGCGQATAPGGASGPTAADAGPVDGDWFVLPIESDPTTLNFISGTDTYQELVARYVADTLVDEGPALETVPRLASAWEFSGDKKTLTLHLRRGVRWHDGAAFTSRDVVFTYRQVIDPANRALNKIDLFRDVVEVSAPDESTVRVVYREPTVLALAAWSRIPMVAEHLFREGEFAASPVHRAPVGTGAYRFVSWERGRQVVLSANDDYFLGRPHLDRIVLKIIPSRSTQLQALLRGDIDWSPVPPEEWEPRSRSRDFQRRFRLFRYPILYLWYIAWNEKSPFFSDSRVRTAMTLSIDRAGYLRNVYRGAGTLAASIFHPHQFGYDSDLAPLPFDLDRAGRLLDEAGWARDPRDGVRRKGGREFRFTLLIFQATPVQEQIAALLQEGLASNGVTVDIRILDFPALLERLQKRDYEAAISGRLLVSDPDPTLFFHSDRQLGASNYVEYADPEMDRLLLQGRHAFDPVERGAIYRRVQAILLRDQPYTFLFFPLSAAALSTRYREVTLSPALGLLRWYPGLLNWYVPRELQKHRRD